MASSPQRSPSSSQVHVKLTPGADRALFLRRLSSTQGVRRVTQLFPSETDAELARLYVLEVDPSHLEALMRELRRDKSLEYAEVAAPRRLIGVRSGRRASAAH